MDGKGKVIIGGLSNNTAGADKFWAPDSTAARPDPESNTDRPLKPMAIQASALEANLKCD